MWFWAMKLARYIVKRIGLAIITIFTLATITFFLTRVAPGDPFTKTKEIPADTMANLRVKYGLDKPILAQYAIQMKQIFVDFDFGTSFRTLGRDVNEIIRDQFPVSAKLGFFSVAAGAIIGIGLGAIAALRRNSAVDRLSMFICVLGLAVPGFLLSYLFQYFFAVVPVTRFGWSASHWLPAAGWGEWRHYMLPGLSLSLGTIATIGRLTRSQMIEVQSADYIKTAKAKGIPALRLVFAHELRNALPPVLSVLGPLLVSTMMGAMIIENIFGVPGLGRVILDAVMNNDYNLIMGVTIFEGSFLVLVMLLTDILYGIVDPRIRVGA
jgi:ABC-type dipeptide/oligopeptide/nickel transport system permease component